MEWIFNENGDSTEQIFGKNRDSMNNYSMNFQSTKWLIMELCTNSFKSVCSPIVPFFIAELPYALRQLFQGRDWVLSHWHHSLCPHAQFLCDDWILQIPIIGVTVLQLDFSSPWDIAGCSKQLFISKHIFGWFTWFKNSKSYEIWKFWLVKYITQFDIKVSKKLGRNRYEFWPNNSLSRLKPFNNIGVLTYLWWLLINCRVQTKIFRKMIWKQIFRLESSPIMKDFFSTKQENNTIIE